MENSDGARLRSADKSGGVQQAFIGLGSNLGDREAQLAHAVGELARLERTDVVAVSSLFETEPVGGPPQGPYLNAVVELATGLPPEALLRELLAIEARAGRVRGVPDGPRTLDLDLLVHDTHRIESPELTLPHPRLCERAFVLAPLAEIAPAVRHPVCHLRFDAILRDVPGKAGVRPFAPSHRGGKRWPSSP